jgi:hypothetical protein
MSWDEAERYAVAWLRDKLTSHGGRLLVAGETKASISNAAHGPLAPLIQNADQVTRRTRHGSHGSGQRRGRVVLALFATPHVMEIASAAAEPDGALCVIEGTINELPGWAQDMVALDLLTGQATVDERSEQLMADLATLAFVGNNGWEDDYGKRDARRILQAIKQRGELAPGVVLGSMMARGAYGDAVDQLAKLQGTFHRNDVGRHEQQ